MPLRSALIALAALSTPAFAVPASVPVQGVLADAEGTTIDGEVSITFRLTRDADGTDELYSEAQLVDVQAGSFTVYLGDVQPLDLALLHSESELWLQLQVDGDEPMNPVRMATSPFAATADKAFEADSLQGASLGDILDQVPGDTAIEALAMGVCYDDVSELRTALDAVYMASGDDVDWSQLLDIPADLADGDADTTYAAGTGLVLTGTTFSADDAHFEGLAQGVLDAPGSLDVAMLDYLATYGVSFDDLADVPDGLADGDDDTTYTAEVDGGLLLDAGAFSIDQDLLDTWILDTVGIAGTFDDTVQSYLDTVGITGSVDDAISTYLDGVGITGSVDDAIAAYLLSTPVSWNDLADIPADLADGDDDTTYTAGDGLSLSGTELSADWASIDARILSTSGISTSVDDSIATYLDGIGITGSVDDAISAYLDGIGLSGDVDTAIADYLDSIGLSGNLDDAISDHLDGIGLSGNLDDAISDHLAANPTAFSSLTGIPAGLGDGDDDTTYSAGAGLLANGTTFSVDQVTVEGWISNLAYTTETELTALLNDDYKAAAWLPTWSDLSGIPTDLADGDDMLTEADVDGFVANNGYAAAATVSTLSSTVTSHVGSASAHHSRFTTTEAVNAVWSADDYLRNNGDTMSGNLTVTGTLAAQGTVTGLAATASSCSWVNDACETDGGALVYLDRMNNLSCPSNKFLRDINVDNCGNGTYRMKFYCCSITVQ